MANRKYMLCEYDLSTKNKKEFLQANSKDEFFANYGIGTPYLTKDKNIHLDVHYM